MPRKTLIWLADAAVQPIASMRPRPDAAENTVGGRGAIRGGRASMRPRPDAAENTRRSIPPQAAIVCFNEAAARCRGKRGRC